MFAGRSHWYDLGQIEDHGVIEGAEINKRGSRV